MPKLRAACCAGKVTAQTASVCCRMAPPTALLSFFFRVFFFLFFLSNKRRRRGGWKAELPAEPLLTPAKSKLQPQPQESSLLMLQHVGAEGRIDLLPAAQVRRGFMEQVAVARR